MKKKRQIILMVILGILLIFFLIDQGIFSSGNKKNKLKKSEEISELTDVQSQEEDLIYAYLTPIPALDWTENWKNDPFFYASVDTLKGSQKSGVINEIFGKSGGVQAKGFKLTGISWHGNSGFALINESVVKEGDVIGGFIVEKIAFHYVILRQGAQALRLSLNE